LPGELVLAYSEDLGQNYDFADTPLKLKKKVFLKRTQDYG